MATMVVTTIGKFGKKVIFKIVNRIPLGTLPIISFPPKLPFDLPKLPTLPKLPNFPIPKFPQIPGRTFTYKVPKLPNLPLPELPTIPFPPKLPFDFPKLPSLPKLPNWNLPKLPFPFDLPSVSVTVTIE